MLAVERRAEIQKAITENKSILVADLASDYNVTEETIRRDLKILENKGVLVRTYGGAYLKDCSMEDVDVSKRRANNVSGKEKIARISRKLISDGDTIFFDSSTTASYIASAIENMHVTVVTNSLSIINGLSGKGNITLVCLGGVYNSTHDSFVGSSAIQNMNKYYFDKAFVSTHSLSIKDGITDTNEEVAAIRVAVANRCRELYLAVGAEKFGQVSFIKSMSYDSITGVISDSRPNAEWTDFFNERGIAVFTKE